MKISRKEATLFVKSNVSYEYVNIRNAMISNHNFPCLSEDKFKLLNGSEKEILTQRFYKIHNKAEEEWQIQSHDIPNDTGITHCQLCGKSPIKNISIIKNKINGIKLVIGSSCVNDFTKITDRNGKNIKQLKKENYIHKNEFKLLEIDKNIISDFDRFSNILKERTIFPKNLKRVYQRLYDEFIKCNKYLSHKSLNDLKINKIKKLYEEIREFLYKFDEFVDNSELSLFGINKKIDEWCLKNYSYELDEELSSSCQIDICTISSIKEPSFLKKIIIEFKPLFENNNMKLLPYFDNDKFILTIDQYPNIRFEVNSSKFIDRYKGYIFQKTEYIIDVISIMKIGEINDSLSLNEALELINYKKYFVISFTDVSIDEIAFFNKNQKKYYVVPFKSFVNKFFLNALTMQNKTQHISLIENYITDKSSSYSPDEFKGHLKSVGIDYN